jgi:flagellar hook-associated protein 3 FlgL
MRISTGMIFDAGVRSMNTQTASLLQLQQQVASGRRILNPSDDPVNAARALEVTQSQSVIAQFSVNHNNATSSLGLEEAQLTSVTEVLARVRELTVQAGNTTLAASDRKAIAFELRARFDELVGLANATDGGGQYIFSGFMGATKPFGGSVDGIVNGTDPMQYFGDEGQRRLQISPSRFIEVSDSGNDVFMRVRDGNGYFSTGFSSTAGKIDNQGTAMIDSGTVTDPSKWNAATSKNYEIVFNKDLSVVPPKTYYDVVDTDSGLSILTDFWPDPLDFSSQREYISGQPILLKGLSIDLGSSVTVQSDPAAGDSFTISPSSSQSVFDTVANLVGALEKTVEVATDGTSNGIARLSMDIGFALNNLDQSTENVLRVRAAIGSRMGEIDSTSGVNEDLDLQYQQTLSQLQDLDYAKTISDLTRKQTDLQAAQQAFVRVSQLSLFNYL